MSEGHIDRRRVLTFGAATALGVWSRLGGVSAQVLKDQPSDQDRADLLQFAVTIPDLDEASKNIREIQIDQTTIDARETTTGLDVEYRRTRPGSVHFGSARFTSAVTLGGSKQLRMWFDEASAGKNIRKNIVVTLFYPDGTARVYGLVGCVPTSYSVGNFDTSSTVQTETLRVKLGRIEFKV